MSKSKDKKCNNEMDKIDQSNSAAPKSSATEKERELFDKNGLDDLELGFDTSDLQMDAKKYEKVTGIVLATTMLTTVRSSLEALKTILRRPWLEDTSHLLPTDIGATLTDYHKALLIYQSLCLYQLQLLEDQYGDVAGIVKNNYLGELWDQDMVRMSSRFDWGVQPNIVEDEAAIANRLDTALMLQKRLIWKSQQVLHATNSYNAFGENLNQNIETMQQTVNDLISKQNMLSTQIASWIFNQN